MGILIKHKAAETELPAVSEYVMNGQGGYLVMNREPFVIAKIVKLRSRDEAINFLSRPVEHYVQKVRGYNIFLSCCGFEKMPDKIVPRKQIETDIDEMCQWYLVNKIQGHKIYDKLFKTV